jgi:hypothetical protein
MCKTIQLTGMSKFTFIIIIVARLRRVWLPLLPGALGQLFSFYYSRYY